MCVFPNTKHADQTNSEQICDTLCFPNKYSMFYKCKKKYQDFWHNLVAKIFSSTFQVICRPQQQAVLWVNLKHLKSLQGA